MEQRSGFDRARLLWRDSREAYRRSPPGRYRCLGRSQCECEPFRRRAPLRSMRCGRSRSQRVSIVNYFPTFSRTFTLGGRPPGRSRRRDAGPQRGPGCPTRPSTPRAASGSSSGRPRGPRGAVRERDRHHGRVRSADARRVSACVRRAYAPRAARSADGGAALGRLSGGVRVVRGRSNACISMRWNDHERL